MDTSTIAYIGTGVAGVALAAWRLRERPTTFGSADWLAPWVASRRGMFRKGGIQLGDWMGLLPVYYRGSGHILTVAPTGSGKGTSAIVPNLLQHPWIFLIDPGGENTAIAARAWRENGYAFHCLNPWDMLKAQPWALPSQSFNPLGILDPRNETFSSDAELIADMIVTRTGAENSSAAFFKDEARSGIRAFLMHIMTKEPDERQTLLTLRKYIAADAEEWTALIEAMKRNEAGSGAIAREAAQLERREGQAPEEFSAILSTMKQDTNFLEDPVMQRALASSNVDLAELKGCKSGATLPGCAVSVVIPLEYIDTHAAYARLIVACAIWTLQKQPLARGRVLFVMDEFPALKRMDRIASGLATLRKYRVWLWPVIQNLGQLKQLYGQNWQTFISNAGLKQFIGAGDLETAQYISELCGDGTIEVKTRTPGGETISETQRRLATVEEVMHSSEKLQIVFAENLKPMVLRKTPYWQRPALRGKFNRNPYQSGTPGLDGRTPYWTLLGLGMRFCAWLASPSPLVMAALCFWLVNLGGVGVSLGPSQASTNSRLVCTFLTTHGALDYSVAQDQRGQKTCPAVTFMLRYR
ncbi:TRAG family protein [Rhizobium etli CNPAF512]|nr:TRAG family protein [Rhizobium etli CNPAF512]